MKREHGPGRPAPAAAIVLAAGFGSRFGERFRGGKLLAPLEDRPILQHVLDRIAAVGLAPVVVVLGVGAREVERALAWRGERRVVNPQPERGLASSVRMGLDALVSDPRVPERALIALGDQPRVGVEVIRALLAAPRVPGRPIAVPRYDEGSGPNPVLIDRAAWGLARRLSGDRGLGPLIARSPELVQEVPVAGANPDVDTPADLAALEASTGGAPPEEAVQP